MAKRIATKTRPAQEHQISAAADPLERLCSNARNLVLSAWNLTSIPTNGGADAERVDRIVMGFVAHLQAVSGHRGPEWQRLRSANDYPVSAAGLTLESYADLALNIARSVYRILLEAESDWEEALDWFTDGPSVRNLNAEKISAKWSEVYAGLESLPAVDYLALAAHVDKELQRARVTAGQAANPKTVGSQRVGNAEQYVEKKRVAVLRALSTNPLVPMTNADIEQELRTTRESLSERTISDVVAGLIKDELAIRPSPKSGVVLTAAGSALAAEVCR